MSTTTGWIGTRPSPLQLGAILAVGTSGVLMAGLQPLLLGALVEAGRITAAQLGQAATAELFVMGAACAYAGARWQTHRLRSIGVLSGLSLAALNGLTLLVSGDAVTLLRALAGVPSGVMIWITIAMIARSPTPERWSGLYLTLQTLAQFLVATALTAWVMSDAGANGGFTAVAILSVVAALAALFVPDRFAPLEVSRAEDMRTGVLGWVALIVAFCWMCGIVAVWVYLEPLSRQAGHAPQVAAAAISASLACQVLGGAVATLLAGRLRWMPTLCVCAVLEGCSLLMLVAHPTPAWFLVAASLFGFLWLFTLPFLVPMVIAADPTRRAAVLIGGAELLGGSLGPLFASCLVSDANAKGAVWFGLVVLSVALGIVTVLRRRAPA